VSTSGIILAGGKASRFGKGKTLIILDDQIMIKRVYKVIKSICDETILVTSEDQLEELSKLNIEAKIYSDKFPEKAAMGGVYTGLMHANNKYSLVVGGDMPFLNGDLLKHIREVSEGFDAAVPKIGNFIEPLHAAYSKSCLEKLQELLNKGNLSLAQLIANVNTRYVYENEIDIYDLYHLSMFNINTQNDLKKAEEIINSKKQRTK
jgi:molybdenum cofactor guanylyltransferase